MRAFLVPLSLAALALYAAPAQADLTLCNKGKTPLAAAIGYSTGHQWISEGWWRIAPQACAPLLQGKLTARFYYLRAVDYDTGKEWGGSATLCTARTAFTIKGRGSCEEKGYRAAGFHEVDTGRALDWTVTLPFAAD